MNFKKHKSFNLKIKKIIESIFVWNYKTKHKWIGIEFSDFREYDFWDNFSNIDFLKSQTEWKTLIRLYDEERELNTYFIIDISSNLLNDPIKKNVLLEILDFLGYIILNNWNKLGAFIYSNNKNEFILSKKWFKNYSQIISNLNKANNIKWFWLYLKNNLSIINNWLKYFNTLKIKKSMIFYFSDSIDLDFRELKITSLQNELIVFNIISSFEEKLEWSWVIWLSNWINKSKFIDLNNKKIKNAYKNNIKNILINNKKKITSYWSKYIYFTESKNIYKEIFNLFKK